ncbi:MAG: AAA family ATPase [Actinobacteria bacterium]|nr:AAA family ATPase [Actinomycetota bacterium]
MRPIVLVGCPSEFAERLVAAAGDALRPRLRRWSEPLARSGTASGLLTFDPAVVVLGGDIGYDEALELAGRLDRARRDVEIVLVAEPRAATLDAAMAAGVRAVLPPDAEGAALRTVLARTAETADRAATSRPAARPQEQPAAAPAGRIVTVTSPKGGAGKTVVASNLAAGLAAVAPRRVAIVDLDLQFGDIAFALSLQPHHTIADLAGSAEVDATTLKVFLTSHEAGLYALCAPEDPAGADEVDPAVTPEILKQLASQFEYVVVDTGAGFTEHTLAALDVSTDAVLIADADVPSIRHLAKAAATLDRLGMGAMRRHFVLNRADARIGIRIADVLESVGLEMDLEIPTSRDVAISLSRGEPIVLSNAKAAMTRRITELVERLGGARAGGARAERSA